VSAGREVRVHAPGVLTTVQDDGRPGLAHLGVPRSGWLDPRAARLANRLVGNHEDEAVLENVLGGLELSCDAAMTVAVTGAGCAVSVDGSGAAFGAAVPVRAGSRLRLGTPARGLRCYVAVGGGLRVPAELGSRATDTLSGLGPAPLAEGDALALGPSYGAVSGVEVWPDVPAEVTVLRCRPGPRLDWCVPDLGRLLAGTTYSVAADSDRVGLRLQGAAVQRVRTQELPSEGMVLGAVQVPPDGQPVVFLRDHPVTGGYPVPLVVDADDLGRCAQLRPGDSVRLVLR
jgi:biotin-dependent carboxylase-like uncharacterized protein